MWTIYKDSTMFALSIALFILTGPWQATFNGVRQWVAVAIVFACHRAILERRPWRFLGAVLVASLFHVSAAVCILFYFVPRTRLGASRALMLMVAAATASTAYGTLLDVVSALKDNDRTLLGASGYVIEQVSPLRILVAFAPLALYLLLTRRDLLKGTDHFYINMVILNAAIMGASAGSAYVARFAAYTSVFVLIAIPRLLNMRDRRLVHLLVGVIIVLYAIFWYIETMLTPALYNFQWIFDRP